MLSTLGTYNDCQNLFYTFPINFNYNSVVFQKAWLCTAFRAHMAPLLSGNVSQYGYDANVNINILVSNINIHCIQNCLFCIQVF